MGQSTCYERRLCLTGNLGFARIRVDMRYKDHHNVRADRHMDRQDTSHWLRMGMDYKDLVVQLQISLRVLNKYALLKTEC